MKDETKGVLKVVLLMALFFGGLFIGYVVDALIWRCSVDMVWKLQNEPSASYWNYIKPSAETAKVVGLRGYPPSWESISVRFVWVFGSVPVLYLLFKEDFEKERKKK